MYTNLEVQDQLWSEIISLVYDNHFKLSEIKKMLKEKYEVIRKPDARPNQKK